MRTRRRSYGARRPKTPPGAPSIRSINAPANPSMAKLDASLSGSPVATFASSLSSAISADRVTGRCHRPECGTPVRPRCCRKRPRALPHNSPSSDHSPTSFETFRTRLNCRSSQLTHSRRSLNTIVRAAPVTAATSSPCSPPTSRIQQIDHVRHSAPDFHDRCFTSALRSSKSFSESILPTVKPSLLSQSHCSSKGRCRRVGATPTP